MLDIRLNILFYLLIGLCSCKNIFVIDSEPANDDDELISVVALYRHGDRSPITSFPSDLYYDSSYWPQGYGQLLPKGMLRQYQLGQWLRNRYNGFLPAEYSSKDFVVYSTDVDRALMSAEANLAGLYPPPATQIWEEDFFWEPIPIHRMATDDPVLSMDSSCEKYDKLLEEVDSSDFFKSIFKENSDLFDKLSKYAGTNVTTVETVANIYSVIYVYSNYNESFVPSWVDDIDLEQVKNIAGLKYAKSTFTDELKRLHAGPFINYLINHLEDTVNNVTDVKFLMLSGHDSTVSAVLGGMGLYDNQPPEFASTIIWELRKNTKEYYVNVLYKRNSTDTYDKFAVGDCAFDCSFDNFKTNLASVNVDGSSWQTECEIPSSSVKLVLSWILVYLLVVIQKFV